MAKTRILLFGASGRMGQEILKTANEDRQIEVVACVGRGAEKNLTKLSKVNAKDIDVVIDFSLPEGFSEILDWCVTQGKPLVSGTTGLEASQREKLKIAAKKIAVIWTANMSMGVAALAKVLRSLPEMDGFDVTIEEFHHNRKKDRPSGTALHLKKALEEGGKNKAQEVVSVRGGGIFGIHKVHFMAQEETLTFEHVALSRAVFARGALRAAKWIAGKKKGSYSIEDVN